MAQRVNIRFLTILTLVVVGGAAAVFVGQRYLARRDPAKFVTAGDGFFQGKEWLKAAEYYKQASALKPNDPDLLVKLGDALEQLSREKVEYAREDEKAWQGALQIKPGHAGALKRLVGRYWDTVQRWPRVDGLKRLKETAATLVRVEPGDAQVAAYAPMATLHVWAGGRAPEITSTDVDEAMAKSQELMKQDPANADLPYYVAVAKLKRAVEALKARDAKKGKKELTETVALFDEALTAQPENAAMHWRAASVLWQVMQLWPGEQPLPDKGATVEAQKAYGNQLVSERKAFLERALKEIEEARRLIDEKDPRYVDVHLQAAHMAMQSGDRAKAEEVYRKLLEKLGPTLQVRLALARLLGQDAAKRDEAIKLLEEPAAKADAASANPAALRLWEVQRRIDLTNLRIDRYLTVQEADQRAALLKQIRDGYGQAEALTGAEVPDVLKMRGRIEQLEGEPVKAIQSFVQADKLFAEAGQVDAVLKYWLARAYLSGGQTAAAEKQLTQAADWAGGYLPPRLQLVQLLVQRGAVEEAKKQLERLEQAAPDMPEVLALKLQVLALDPKRDEGQYKATFARLPEQTVIQQVAKARVALMLKGQEGMADARRLLEAALGQEPANDAATGLLIQVYDRLGEKAKALELLAAARKRHPENDQLRDLEGLMAGKTPLQLAEEEPDAFKKAVRRARLAAAGNNPEEYSKQLKAAEALKPDDADVQEMLFGYYIQRRQWPEATAAAEKVARSKKDTSNGLLPRFRLAMAKGDVPGAVALGQQLVDQFPEFAQSWVAHGQALYADGKYDEALARFLGTLERQADNTEALGGAISCYERLGRPHEVKRFIDEQGKRLPGNAYLAEQLVQWQLRHGAAADVGEAVKNREQVLARNPENLRAYLLLAEACRRGADVEAQAGNQAGSQRYVERARQTYVNAKEKWPDAPEPYTNLGQLAVRTGDAAQAEAVLKAWAARDKWKDAPEPALMLAELYTGARRLPEAEAALREALAKSKKAVEVQLRLAEFLAGAGRVDDALKELAASNTEDARVQQQRVELLIDNDRQAEAETVIKEQLAKQPDSPLWSPLLGLVYMNTNRADLAAKQLDEALAKDPQNVRALAFRGMLRLRQAVPNLPGAVADLTTARNAEPRSLSVRMALSEALLNNRDGEGAVRELESLVADAPLLKQARLKLVDLYAGARPPRWLDADRLIAQAKAMPQLATDVALLNQEANVRLAQGRVTEAADAATRARQGAPADAAVAQTYVRVLLAAQQYDAVVQETDRLLKDNKDLLWALQFRAAAKHGRKDTAGAVADYEAALATEAAQKNEAVAQQLVQAMAAALGPDEALKVALQRADRDVAWKLTAARLYEWKRDTAKARQTIEAALAQKAAMPAGQRRQALQMAGTMHMSGSSPDYAKAQQYYLELLSEWPDDVHSLNNLAFLLAEGVNPPRPDQARTYSQKAYDLTQRDGGFEPLVADTHGWVLALCKDLPQAITVLQKVVDRAPFAEAYYHLGQAYLWQEQAAAAQKQFDAATALIERAEKRQEPVDRALKARVESAAQQAAALRGRTENRTP